uniref:DUF3741 domain-containing protein n=1 Tax=Arabidopsis thaliana TaxID=3702 RepID=Q1PFF9_ARATH|nr:unknown [Arabidopsis thaliana]
MTGELQETTAPCAAITEKRPNRLGGCVGVFFQLFDWNRRFAKKKLFSRKSLLPGKQVSKRFGGNEKMLKSKLNLIDDENRGSFPNRNEVMEVKKHEMRSPSLVARLMGLESMPSNHRDKGKNKKKKPLFSQIQDTDKCDLFDVEEEEEDSGVDKLRPQKMQRTTGVCDRRVAVKKFGSEALQIKNVLTRVRKHHQYNHQHQKLASPVRSPRMNRRSSRLIDAAARILEPGKRNAKGAIAYPGSTGIRRFENAAKEPVVVSPEFQCGYNNSVASCKSCGSLVDVNGSIQVVQDTGNNMACVSESTPFQRSKRNVFWSSIGNANSEYTSPGSVLDASFSNESCFSNSFDNISGQMRLPLEPIEPDWDILEDYATSFKNSTSDGNYQAIASLISHVSNVLRCLSNTGLILTQQRFTIAREVIIHTELLVGTTTTQENYLIGPELFDELMIYAARSDNLVNLPGLTGGFLVDAMIEHLEETNISCGLLKPLTAKQDELIRGVIEEVPKWARVNMDEVIGIEMDLETHLFGVGSEIAYEILRCLIGELATDLYW